MNTMTNRTKKGWINLGFLVVTLIVNGLGAAGFINGLSQEVISDRYNTLITPSGPTFSIWGVIYTLLIISLILMIAKKDGFYYQKAIDEITVLFRISCILNIGWIILFSYLQVALSTVLILGYTITLAIICLKLKRIHIKKYFLLPLTFGIYTGWVTIATVVNLAAALVKSGWGRFGIEEGIWAAIILIAALAIVFIILRSNRNAAFPLSIAWAYLGIYQALEGFDYLKIISLAGMAVLIGMAAIQLYLNNYGIYPDK